MARKGESIYKRKDGRWEARYIKGRDENGKALYGYIYGRGYLLVKEKRNVLKLKNTITSPKVVSTLNEITAVWLISVRSNVRESTYQTYKGHVINHINPDIGHIRVDSLNDEIVKNFIQSKLEKGRLDSKGGLSPKTVKEIKNTLKMALISHDKYIETKLSSLNFNIEVSNNIVSIVSEEDQAKLINNAENISLKIAIILAVYCGLRVGEICALANDDIDLNNQTISISKTLYRIRSDVGNARTKIVLAPTKSKTSNRIIPIPKSVFSLIKKHKSKSMYFINNNDKPFEPRLLTYHLNKEVDSLMNRKISFHTLRHTFATRCIAKGCDYNTLSELLGHANASTTMNIYVHSDLQRKKEFMDLL